MSNNHDDDAIPGELVDKETDNRETEQLPLRPVEALTRRTMGLVGVPVTVNDLAALEEQGIKIIEARNRILRVARQASISMTRPEDWTLYRNTEGQIVAYLAETGCNRIASIWGIEIFNVRKERQALDAGQFMWIFIGCGRSLLTGQTVEDEEGGRGSAEDIMKNARGAELELLVRKCARANLDGRIIRELTGMGSVPLDELKASAPGHNWENARKGRGYGSQASRSDERMGTATIDTSTPVPPCPKCGGAMWDNRRDPKRTDRSPIFKCKKKGGDPNCDAAIWPPKDGGTKPPARNEGQTAPATAPRPVSSSEPPPERDDLDMGSPAVSPTTAPPQAAAARPAATPPPAAAKQAAPQGNVDAAETKGRFMRLIRAQFKGRHWTPEQQAEYLEEYYDSASLDGDNRRLDLLTTDALSEINERLKKE